MTELTNVCNRVSLNTINQTVNIPSMRANPEGIPLWTLKEDKTNKVTSLNSQSTDTQYPSAKCVYDAIQNVPGFQQIQSDWDQTDTEAVDFIKNKPTIPVVPTDVSAFTNDAGYITINDVPAQVQSDWNQTDNQAVDYIKNKPTIPTVPTDVSAFINDAGYITISDVPTQAQADWNQTDTSAVDFIKNKPTIPSAQVNSDWNSSSGVSEILNKPDLSLKEDVSNKVTSISSSSTDTEYPSAKCVFDAIQAGASSRNVSSYYLGGSSPINVDATGMEIGDLRIYTLYMPSSPTSTVTKIINFTVSSGNYAYGKTSYGQYESYTTSNVTTINYSISNSTYNTIYYEIKLTRIS